MPSEKTSPEKNPPDGTLTGVEVFSAGLVKASNQTHPEEWTAKEMDQAVKNYRLLSSGPRPILIPKAKIGHEPAQVIANAIFKDGIWTVPTPFDFESSETPAVGWMTDLKQKNGRLHSDWDKVPAIVKSWIERGYYSTVSAEIVREADEPLKMAARKQGITLEGPVLKAVAFLGASPPAVKDILHLTSANFSDSNVTSKRLHHLRSKAPKRIKSGQTVLYFSEVQTMSRQDAIAWLTANVPGFDPATITDATPDEVLAAWCNSVKDAMAKAAGAGGAQHSDAGKGVAAGGTSGVPIATPVAGGSPQSVTYKYTESQLQDMMDRVARDAVSKALGANEAKLAGFDKRLNMSETAIAKRADLDKEALVNTFCESQVKAWKMSAAEADRTSHKSVWRRLMSADNTKVLNFSENGKPVALTELQCQMAEIEARTPQPLNFNERITQDEKAVGVHNDFAKRAEAAYKTQTERHLAQTRAN